MRVIGLRGLENKVVFKSDVLVVGATVAKPCGEVTFSFKVTLLKDPVVAAFGVGEDLPSVVIEIPKVKTVGAITLDGSGDVFDGPFLGLLAAQLVRLIDLLVGQDIKPIVVAAMHFVLVLDLHNGVDMSAAKLHHHGNGTRANHREAQELLVKNPRLLQISTAQGFVGDETGGDGRSWGHGARWGDGRQKNHFQSKIKASQDQSRLLSHQNCSCCTP